MGSTFVGDLLVANAMWARDRGLSLAVRRGARGWTAVLANRDGEAVVEAERGYLDETLMLLYTAAQTASLDAFSAAQTASLETRPRPRESGAAAARR